MTTTTTTIDVRPAVLGDPCARCGQRPSETWWVADGGSLALAHGMAAPWCELCAVTAQLEHACKMAESIPGLIAELGKLKEGTEENDDGDEADG